jgi:hypothetical protein
VPREPLGQEQVPRCPVDVRHRRMVCPPIQLDTLRP